MMNFTSAFIPPSKYLHQHNSVITIAFNTQD